MEKRSVTVRTARLAGNHDGRPLMERLQRRAAVMNDRMVFPYLLLLTLVAVLVVALLMRLLAEVVEQSFINSIVEDSRIVNAELSARFDQQGEIVRRLAQTEGLSEAIKANDPARLLELLEPQARQANLDSLMVLDGAGNAILRLDAIRNAGPDEVSYYQITSGGNYAYAPFVVTALLEPLPGPQITHSGLLDAPSGPIIYTAQSIAAVANDQDEGRVAGVLLAGGSLERLLVNLQSASQTNLIVYSAPQGVIGSTLPDWRQAETYQALQLDPAVYQEAATSFNGITLRQMHTLTIGRQEYYVAYSPFVIDGQTTGVLGIVRAGDPLVKLVTTYRPMSIAVLSLGMAALLMSLLIVVRRLIAPFITALEEENARTNAILGSIADGVVFRDPSGQVTLANPAARLMLSQNGKFDTGPLDPLKIQMMQSQSAPRIEVGSRVLGTSLAQVHTPDGTYLGDVLVLRDVTREAMVERTKDSFLDHIGHELRTPLTVIQGYSDVMRLAGDRLTSEMRERAARAIFEQAQTLARMIDEIIELTAMQGGSMVLQLKPVRLNEVVRTTLDEWYENLAAAGLLPHFEEDASDPVVEADIRRLRHAFDALLRNACHYSPAGGPLTVSLHRQEDWVCLSIRDPGVGISEKDLPHIFEPFYRGSPVDSNGEPVDVRGTGQGLYLVKSIVEAHSGRVGVESEVGKGSTFYIYLPLAKVTEPLEQV